MRPLTREDATRMRLDSTDGVVVIKVENGKNAADAGIRVGDVIIAANGEPVSDVDTLTTIINGQGKKRGAVMFYIIRQGQKLFKTVEITSK